MKILMLAPQPFFEPRGTPFSVLARLRALSALGHEVDLVTYHIGQDVAIPGVTIHRIPRVFFINSIKIGPSWAKAFLDIFLLFKAVIMLSSQRYDLLHTHEEASFFGVLLARVFRIPHLYDMHSSLAEQLSNMRVTSARPVVRLLEWLERRVIHASTAVITICPALEERVRRINGKVSQVMIENASSEDETLPVSPEELQAFRAKHRLPEGREIVLYTGTLEPYQGIELLVRSARRVMEQCKSVLFLVVGGKPEQVRHYQERVRELGISPHSFYFTGVRPSEEIPMFIEVSQVLVSPRTDGTNTPLKVYSYLASGKPIVATNLYTHTQVLDTNVAVLTETDEESFARGIISVLADRQLAARLVLQAKKLSEARYSYDVYLDKTEQVLRLATAGKEDRSPGEYGL